MAGLTLEDLLEVARRTVGPTVAVRDMGLLSAPSKGVGLVRIEAERHRHGVPPNVSPLSLS
ncbi:hypothetical protein [Blastococcus sp. CT_GayMR20]|uniref:hypothetical protein n=1 Tax=Blastococcus sp. CT_GayMR20 TaxID=2559609 RepID=UPI001430C3AB|nr:hypothetical protein [Blastococcus sp. CT_GayMR20]